jgi:serine/threonine protein kinase
MKPDRYRQIEGLFEQVLEQPPDARAAFLASACGGDPSLHAELVSLLSDHGRSGSFLEKPIVGDLSPVLARLHAAALAGTTSQATDAEALTPVQIGPYRIAERLGQGGMGTVYRGIHVESDQSVAIKAVRLPSAVMLHSIRREIRALAQIRHPGIVRILDEGIDEGLPWYAMELLQGTTLRHFAADLRERGSGPEAVPPTRRMQPSPDFEMAPRWWTESLEVVPRPEEPSIFGDTAPAPASRVPQPDVDRSRPPLLSGRPPAAGGCLDQVLTLVRRICGPLAFLHGEGVVHRDLKPDNIFVRLDGTPVLVDFGLTTQFSGHVSRESFELAGTFEGTAAYMAPEQIRGEFVDARADLYALGCILYELVTGQKPFTGRNLEAVLWLDLEAAPLRP